MTINVEKVINHMYALKKKGITYSMYGSRTGVDGTADCSGAVYSALRAGGGYNYGWVPSTESQHDYLLKLGYKLVANNTSLNAKRGDIFIWGKRGASAGAGGHTGMFIDGQNVIHCNYGRNGVTIGNHDNLWAWDGRPYFYAYRYVGAVSQAPKKQPTTGIIRVNYSGKGGVRLKNGAGKYVNKYVNANTAWKAFGFSDVGVLIGKDEYLPYKYAKIVIDFVEGYGVNAVTSKYSQVKNTNTKFKHGTSWKVVGGQTNLGMQYFKVSSTEFIKGEYTR